MGYIFDSSAVIRYLDDKAGADRVEEILEWHSLYGTRLLISVMQWGEVAKIVGKQYSVQATSDLLSRLAALGFEATAVYAQDAVRAAIIQHSHKLSYADAFAVVLAQDNLSSVHITANFDFKLAERLISIEFLPPNP